MDHLLAPQRQRELLSRGFSRRDFVRIAALMGAAGTSLPFGSPNWFA